MPEPSDLLELLEQLTFTPVVPDPDPDPDPGPARYDARTAGMIRYLNGWPLVRKHRRTDEGWSWLCPVETCQTWQIGYDTPQACRVGWYAHCATPGHDPLFTPAWPADVPCEVTQLVAHPGGTAHQVMDVMTTLIYHKQAVDREGRALTFDTCLPCVKPDGASHPIVSGTTCVQQVPCPACGVPAGTSCDRTDRTLPWQFGQTSQMPGAHWLRFDAAAADEAARWAAGDMTLPAAWLPAPAPSRRRRQPKAGPELKATLQVAADLYGNEGNELWKWVVYEYRDLGRVLYNRDGVIGIGFESKDMAAFTANMATTFYGIPTDRVQVLEGAARQLTPAELVAADLMQVLRQRTDATPERHLAWAVGAHYVTSAEDFGRGGWLDARKLASKHSTHGFTSTGVCLTGDGDHVRIDKFAGPDGSGRTCQKVPWRAIVSTVTASGELLDEVRAVIEELAAYPIGSREYRVAREWSRDVAAEVWLACRPSDLAPFDPRASVEQQGIGDALRLLDSL